MRAGQEQGQARGRGQARGQDAIQLYRPGIAHHERGIAELKHDLGADGFCLKEFFATEAAFQAVLLLFNLLSEFQRAAGLPAYREPATLRTQVFTWWRHPWPGRAAIGPSPVAKLGRIENTQSPDR
jgi:hypothetical protein